MLGGHSSTVYDDTHDLLAVHRAAEDPDRLTVFVRDNFGFLFQVMTFLD